MAENKAYLNTIFPGIIKNRITWHRLLTNKQQFIDRKLTAFGIARHIVVVIFVYRFKLQREKEGSLFVIWYVILHSVDKAIKASWVILSICSSLKLFVNDSLITKE